MNAPNVHPSNLPYPQNWNQYKKEDQELIRQYMNEFTDRDRQTYMIAYEHLGTSFDIVKSNGFSKWKDKQ
jgi:hypothetical protein